MSTERRISWILDSVRTLEGAGFPVRRPFPTRQLSYLDPFLLFDHLGPVAWGPGEGVGAPDHPHRGFETVTYLLSGEMEHRDSAGHHGKLGAGDVQWMTAGSGVVHSELPSAAFMRDGGVMHGFQLWVNLPARDKMMPPRYQDIPAAHIPEATSADGQTTVRVIAGEALGKSAVIDTRIPITYLHYTLAPGAATRQPIAPECNTMCYVIAGTVLVGPDWRAVREGQLAHFGDGADVLLANDAPEPAQALLLAGAPLHEPVARHGPFVMNTQEEIFKAIRDYQEGRLGGMAA
jgi:hypothetical protein